jgi:hypothetical protein
MQRPRGAEVADILRRHGPEYRLAHPLPRQHLRVMRAVETCRTAELGGHKEKCADCGHVEISYNSCRNRHCPKCQVLRKERWIEDRGRDLLPIEYYHVVFTVPSELNPLFIMNPRRMFNLLFRCASETLMELADNPRHLGARIGFMVILHTWGQNLMDHPHVHCVVTGGGLSPENRWVSCRKGFFIPVRVMSALFRGKFLDRLRQSFEDEELIFPGGIAHLKAPVPLRSSGEGFTTRNGSSTASLPLPGRMGSCSTWAGTPTGSPSATTVSLHFRTGRSPSAGGTTQTATGKRP